MNSRHCYISYYIYLLLVFPCPSYLRLSTRILFRIFLSLRYESTIKYQMKVLSSMAILLVLILVAVGAVVLIFLLRSALQEMKDSEGNPSLSQNAQLIVVGVVNFIQVLRTQERGERLCLCGGGGGGRGGEKWSSQRSGWGLRYTGYCGVPELPELPENYGAWYLNANTTFLFPSSQRDTFSPSHLLIFSPSHLLTFSPSHLLTFSPSHLLTCTPSHIHYHFLHSFTHSYLHTFIQIFVMDLLYRRIAVSLNNWENHRTDREYKDNLTLKVFIFKFMNNYNGLFIIAFIKPTLPVNSSEACLPKDANCSDELQAQVRRLSHCIARLYRTTVSHDCIARLYRTTVWPVSHDCIARAHRTTSVVMCVYSV